MKLKSEFFSELIGTFILVLAGCGAIMSDVYANSGIGTIGIALVFGIAVLIVIYSVGNVSGAHLNPAVTIGFYFAKRIDRSKIFTYVSAQVVGGLIACFVLFVAYPDAENFGVTIPKVEIWRVFILEVVFTFILMFVILNVSTGHMEKGIMAGVAVGGTVFVLAAFGGSLTGASMNPARSIAPAVFSNDFTGIWIYITAPIIGAILASPLCRIIQTDNCCDSCATETK